MLEYEEYQKLKTNIKKKSVGMSSDRKKSLLISTVWMQNNEEKKS